MGLGFCPTTLVGEGLRIENFKEYVIVISWNFMDIIDFHGCTMKIKIFMNSVK